MAHNADKKCGCKPHPKPHCPCKPSDCLACVASKSNNDVKLRFKKYFANTITHTILIKVDAILSESSLTPTQQQQVKVAVKSSIAQVAPIIYCNFYDIAVTLQSDAQNAFFTSLLLNLRANMITTLIDFKLQEIYDDACLTLTIKETIVSTWMLLINDYARKNLFPNSNC